MKPSRSGTRFTSSIITTNRNSTITAPTYTSTSVIARNSASSSSQIAALVKKASTRSSAGIHRVLHGDDRAGSPDQDHGEQIKNGGFYAHNADSVSIMCVRSSAVGRVLRTNNHEKQNEIVPYR